MRKELNIFLISSSLPIFIITMIYIGIAFKKSGRPSHIPYELFPIFIPILYGIFGLVNYFVVKKYNANYSILIGMIFGLLLSIIGRFQLNLPKYIFGMNSSNEYLVHIFSIITYAIIFRIIMTPLQQYVVV